METQHTNHTLQEKALKLKKQRRRQILASLLGIAILAWGIVEVARFASIGRLVGAYSRNHHDTGLPDSCLSE